MTTMNHAVVFLKPIADTKECEAFVVDFLEKHGIRILEHSTKDHKELDEIIDAHYSVISSYARRLAPKEFKLTDAQKAQFKDAFGVEWDTAIELNEVHNMKFKPLPRSLLESWDHPSTKKIKLGDGFKIGQVQVENDSRPYFVVNGFYEDMRQEYTAEGSLVKVFSVEFSETDLSWEKFRNDLIGAANPEKAKPSSLRYQILQNYKELNLSRRPSHGMNGVHASAGPFEGLLERKIWFGSIPEKDPFWTCLLENNIDPKTVEYLLENPEVQVKGERKSVYVLTENLNESEAVGFASELQKQIPQLAA